MSIMALSITSKDHIIGNLDGEVTVIEYGDYECPFCAKAHPVVNRLLEQYDKYLRYVYRHFPLSEIHPHAQIAAETAEFAAAYNRFWPMHNLLYENQPSLSIPLILELAEQLSLSSRDLSEVLRRRSYLSKVHNDFLSGVKSGVNGTPTFFINEARYQGPFDFEALSSAINGILRSKA